MKTTSTWTALIYCDLREDCHGREHSLEEVVAVCRDRCAAVGLEVTVTPTTFVCSAGQGPGAVVGLINCPRVPFTPVVIRALALELAWQLKAALGQERLTVVLPEETVMLGVASTKPLRWLD